MDVMLPMLGVGGAVFLLFAGLALMIWAASKNER